MTRASQENNDMAASPELIDRARERFAVRDYHGAVLLLREVTSTGGGFADAYNLLGLSYALIDRTDDALAAFDAALERNPRYVEAHLNRAVLLNSLGRDSEAQESFAAAEQLGQRDASGFPAMVADRLANAHANLAREYREAGSLFEATEQYRRALTLRPQFADIRVDLARTLLEMGRYDQAAETLDVLLAENRDSLDAMLLRGLCGYLAGDLDQADAIWTRASRLRPDEPRLAVYRAMLARRRSATP